MLRKLEAAALDAEADAPLAPPSMKRYIPLAVIVAALLGLLALASFVTTAGDWIGAIHGGDFCLSFRNREGQPIQGVVLRVYHDGTRDDAFGYLENYGPGQMIVSDDKGQMIARQRRSRFGGSSWDLFWIIPMGDQPPKYDCEITAEGYRPLRLDVHHVFDSPLREFVLER